MAKTTNRQTELQTLLTQLTLTAMGPSGNKMITLVEV